MLQIEYKNGLVEIQTKTKIYYVSEIVEISLVYELIQCYRSESYDENTYTRNWW